MSNHPSLWSDFGAIAELDDRAAETIGGGAYEVFTLVNDTNATIDYTIDGVRSKIKPGTFETWTAWGGGILTFDADAQPGFVELRVANLGNGDVYVFKPNLSTAGNPFDIGLYQA
jgi:hypothetical protein